MTIGEAIRIAKNDGAWREYMDCSPHPTYYEVLDGIFLVRNEDASDCWLEGQPLED